MKAQFPFLDVTAISKPGGDAFFSEFDSENPAENSQVFAKSERSDISITLKLNELSTEFYRELCDEKNFTEIYSKDRSVAHSKRYEGINARHPGLRKLFEYRERDYRSGDKELKKYSYDQRWFYVKNNYIEKKNLNRSTRFFENREVFPELPKSRSVNLKMIWESQTSNLSKSKSCSAVIESEKISPFKLTFKNGLPGFRRNS